MNGLRIAIIAMLLVLAVALAAQAAPLRTLVVATDGDDAADGITRPWRTLQRAANLVRAGDLVIVRAGHYAGFKLRTPGSSSTGTATVLVPSATPVGTYFLIACADQPKAVAESNEQNNCRTAAAAVKVTR